MQSKDVFSLICVCVGGGGIQPRTAPKERSVGGENIKVEKQARDDDKNHK